MSSEPSIYDEFYFQWHITERCNMSCAHCYQEDKPADELPLDELLKIVDQIEQAVVKWEKMGTIALTGGEPFIRHDELYSLMARIDDSDSISYYDVLTNGSFISDKEASHLSTCKKLRRIQLSLEGATAESNDVVRGIGSFNATISAVRHLREHRIDVSVMTTVTRRNKDELSAIVDLLSKENVQAMTIERFIPEGRGSGISDQVLTASELRDVFEKMYQIAMSKPPVRILLYRPLFAIIATEDHTIGALCSVGNNSLSIMPDGSVFPCRRLPIPIGNILTDGLFKIWYDSELLWKIRDPKNLEGKCADCELLSQCRGCRAAAYFATGNCMAEDPQCWK